MRICIGLYYIAVYRGTLDKVDSSPCVEFALTELWDIILANSEMKKTLMVFPSNAFLI